MRRLARPRPRPSLSIDGANISHTHTPHTHCIHTQRCIVEILDPGCCWVWGPFTFLCMLFFFIYFFFLFSSVKKLARQVHFAFRWPKVSLSFASLRCVCVAAAAASLNCKLRQRALSPHPSFHSSPLLFRCALAFLLSSSSMCVDNFPFSKWAGYVFPLWFVLFLFVFCTFTHTQTDTIVIVFGQLCVYFNLNLF